MQNKNVSLVVGLTLAVGACGGMYYYWQPHPAGGAAPQPPVAAPADTVSLVAPRTGALRTDTSLSAPPSGLSNNLAAPTAEPPRKRAWAGGDLARLGHPAEGTPIRFELVAGAYASGTVRHVEIRDGALILISGDLAAPEPGRFFFQKQTLPGKAGDFAGLVEFPASK